MASRAQDEAWWAGEEGKGETSGASREGKPIRRLLFFFFSSSRSVGVAPGGTFPRFRSRFRRKFASPASVRPCDVAYRRMCVRMCSCVRRARSTSQAKTSEKERNEEKPVANESEREDTMMRNVYTSAGAGMKNEGTKTREDGKGSPAGNDRERSIDDESQ